MAKRVASLFADISAKTDKFEAGAKKVKGELKGVGSEVDKSKLTLKQLGTIGATALAGIATAAVVMKKAFEFGKEGAQLQYMQERFDRLAVSVGTTGDVLLGKMKEATKGTLSDLEAMAAASDLLALGLAKDTDEAIRLATVQAGLAMDTTQLVLTLTNQTTMRFDQLGVSVDGFKEKVAELKETGLDANAAFKEAFLQQAEMQLDKVGNAADSAAGEYARLEANVKNATDAFKIHVSQGLLPVVEQMNRQFDAQKEEISLINMGVDAINAKRYAMLKLKDEQGRITEQEREILEGLEAQVGAYKNNIEAAYAYDNALKNIKTSTVQLNDTLIEQNFTYDDTLGYILRAQDRVDDYRATIADLDLQLEEGTIKQDEYNASVDRATEAFQRASKEQAYALLLEQLKGGAEGFSEAEFDLALNTAVNWGLMDKSVADAAREEMENINRVIDTADEMNQTFGESLTRLDNLGKLSGQKWVYTFQGVMIGDWPELGGNVGSPFSASKPFGGPRGGSRGRHGGQFGIRDLIVPPGYQNDSYILGVSSGERVNVETPAQQMKGGGGQVLNIYAPVTMMVTKEATDILDIR